MTAPNLKQLAADVRQVWTPPGGRAWSKADVRIEKLLQAIESDTPTDAVAAATRAFPIVSRVADCAPGDCVRIPDADIDEAQVVREMLRLARCAP